MLKQKKWSLFFAALLLGIVVRFIGPDYFTETSYAMQKMYVAVTTQNANDGTSMLKMTDTTQIFSVAQDTEEAFGKEERVAQGTEEASGKEESIAQSTEEASGKAEERAAQGTEEASGMITTQNIWISAYRNLMYGTESSLEKVAALALSDVKAADLKLMSSSTDHVVTYHGRRFAITEEDYEVLLKIVEAEASTEDIKGKMLVANVIMNRLEVGFCGNTIVEVVFAEGQFAPVANGRFFKMIPSEETIEAVERVLNGEDISKGALYFMQRNAASKKGIRWFDENLKFLFEYGCHEFYKEKN